jgi:hypothetical protein
MFTSEPTAVDELNIFQDSKKEQDEDAHHGELTIVDGMNIVSTWTKLDDYESLFCDSYQTSCDNCMPDSHFTFQ